MHDAGRLVHAPIPGVAAGGVAAAEPHVLEQLVVDAAGTGVDGLVAGGSDATAAPSAGHRVHDAHDGLACCDPGQVGKHRLRQVREAELSCGGELHPGIFEPADDSTNGVAHLLGIVARGLLVVRPSRAGTGQPVALGLAQFLVPIPDQ